MTKEQITDYLISLLKPLSPDVAVECKSDDLGVLFLVTVPDPDKGRIIGREGETIRCVRHIVSLVGFSAGIRASVKIA